MQKDKTLEEMGFVEQKKEYNYISFLRKKGYEDEEYLTFYFSDNTISHHSHYEAIGEIDIPTLKATLMKAKELGMMK